MNRRIRNPNGSGSKPAIDRFLKPGALARIRDSKISARSPARSFKIQILSPPPSPVRSIAAADGSPCFVGRTYGPRLFNRKKLVATKRIFFVSSNPDPVVDSSLDLRYKEHMENGPSIMVNSSCSLGLTSYSSYQLSSVYVYGWFGY